MIQSHCWRFYEGGAACDNCNTPWSLRAVEAERLPGRKRHTIHLCAKCLGRLDGAWRLRWRLVGDARTDGRAA
jgi:hypothetical protein